MERTVTIIRSAVMSRKEREYNGNGKSKMDKVHYQEYSRGNQTLAIESSFSGTVTIQQIIKQYLTEHKSKIKLDGLSRENYNESCNMAVVTFTKEGRK